MTGSERRLAPAASQLLALRGGEFHHLGPLVGVAPPELAEFLRAHDDRPPAHLGEARRDARIGEAGVDLAIERGNDRRRRAGGHARTGPAPPPPTPHPPRPCTARPRPRTSAPGAGGAAPVPASARTAPEGMCGSEFGNASTPASTRPPMRSVTIGAPPW